MITAKKKDPYSFKSRIIAFVILALPICALLEDRIPVLSYSDDAFALLCGFYILKLLFMRKIPKDDIKILLCLSIMILVGVISNIYSELINSYFAVLVDAFWLCKIFFIFIAIKNFSTEKVRKETSQLLYPIATCMILVTFVCAALNVFTDIGMSDGERYGIRNFLFIFQTPGKCGLVIAGCLTIVLMVNRSTIETRVLTILSSFVMVCTTKGLIIIIVVINMLLPLFLKRKNKLTWKSLAIIVTVCLFISVYQIQTYFMNMDSPRARFIVYGVNTANTYFPLGSGFATYGSEMARRYYSLLYYQYGFNSIWGLSVIDDYFLNDNYFAMVVAQIGWFGPIIYAYILYMLYKQINNAVLPVKIKTILLGMYISIAASTIGSALIKSSFGVFIFVIIGMIMANSATQTVKKN